MRFLATKDTHEREDEEAERLVRPSPKLKPPRKDLRRQTTDTDRDSDTSGDPDLKGDPDLSLNYKTVGGSLIERVVYRFIEAKQRSNIRGPSSKQPGRIKAPKVKVYDTESERTVEVSRDTLKDESSRYKTVQPNEDGAGEDTPPASESVGEGRSQPSVEDPSGPPEQEPSKPRPPLPPKLQEVAGGNTDALYAFLEKLPTTETDDAGQTTIYDAAAEQRVPLERASEKAIQAVVEKYTQQVQGQSFEKVFEPLGGDKAMQAVVKDLAFIGGHTKGPGDQEGEVAKRIRDLQKSGDPLEGMSIAKHVPELAGVELPENIKTLKDLTDAAAAYMTKAPPAKGGADEAADGSDGEADAANAKKVVERFTDLPPEKAKEFLQSLRSADVDAEGNPVFLDTSKKPAAKVPFEKLPAKKQQQIAEQYENQQARQQARDFMTGNPDLKDVLQNVRGLAGKAGDDDDVPDYIEAIQKAVEDGDTLDELPLGKTLPALKGAKGLPSDVVSVGDLVRFLEKGVIPPPPRKKFTEEDAFEARVNTHRALPAGSAESISKLHPTDQQQVVEEYDNLLRNPVAAKKLIQELGGLPADIESLEPPKTVKDKKGKDVDFESLSPERQAVELQRYKNRAHAVKAMMQKAEADHYTEQGLPKGLVDTLVYHPDLDARATFNEAVKTVSTDPLPSKGEVRKMLKGLDGEKQAQLAAYYQARDFQDVNNRYVRMGVINEHLTSDEMVRELSKATKELGSRSKLYPEGTDLGVASAFRNKVLRHLESLQSVGAVSDDKLRAVKDWVATQDKAEGASKTPDSSGDSSKMFKWFKTFGKRRKEASRRVAGRYLSFCEASGMMSNTPHNTREAVYWGVEPYPEGEEGFAEYNEWEQAHARDLDDKAEKAILDAAKGWLGEPILDLATMGEGVPDARFRAALDFAIQATEGGKYAVGLHPAKYNELLARLAGKPTGETLLTVREASVQAVSLYNPRSMRTHAMTASTEIRKYAAKLASANPSIAFDLMGLADKVAQQEKESDEQGGGQTKQQKQAQQQADDSQQQGGKQQKQAQQQDDAEQAPAQQKQAYTALRSAVIRTASANPVARQALGPVLRLIQQIG